MASKNHTISRIVAKTLVRLLIIILAFSIYLYFAKGEQMASTVHFENMWSIAFPIVLFIIVFVLLFLVLKHKFIHGDVNWLFSLSCIFLIVYLILLYSRIYPIV
ncbi:hypothetical protein SAMN05660841_02170 [Sphingobacterium nematocida]|uniref:Uncharacterized protein n=1 Tax=Sphingobacterium nematocida TaxID=1513896 RepID=A0A1T5DT20_9SPHI|nr:hypothetical protein SAMN05660841_02170 [Sphingobacterium nematocida]